MSDVNLYDVLEIKSSATRKEIIQSYRKLVRIYHPDKSGGNVELYELINHAFDILGNKNKRNEYDELRKLSNSSSKKFNELKDDFEKFNKNITPLTEKEKKKQRDRFEEQFEYIEEDKLSKDESDKLIDDIELLRDQDDIENTHDNVFEKKDFDLKKFNKLYEKVHNKNDLTQYVEKPEAANVISTDQENMNLYSSYDNTTVQLTKEDLENLGDVDDEQKYEDNLDDLLEKQLKNREEIKDMDFGDFQTNYKNDFTVTGHLINGEVGNLQWENEEEISDRYQKLLQYRKNNQSNK